MAAKQPQIGKTHTEYLGHFRTPKVLREGHNTLPVDKEAEFQEWYKKQAQELGLHPNPDDPEHQYDYRGAFLSQERATWQKEHEQRRWPDRYKRKGYRKE